MTNASKPMRYMPQLDGLRALAVAAVMFHHYLPEARLNVWAIAGVKLFFVLSGFLITGILLKSRDLRERTGQLWGFTLRQFYARRFLRIFPLYYFVIAAAFAINLKPVREILPWLLSYTLNFYMVFQGWYVDHFAHFWTLAVEEQFYVLWPWVILFVPKRALIPACCFFILAGPLFRLAELTLGTASLGAYLLTPACLDALCMGALLAMVRHQGIPENAQRLLSRLAFSTGAVTIGLLHVFPFGGRHALIYNVFFDLSLAGVFYGLIDKTSAGLGGRTGRLLESAPLVYLGKISYGMYVYHPFMPDFCRYLLERTGMAYPSSPAVQFVLQAAAAVAVSSLSWFLMEKPINDLKRFFEYSGGPARAKTRLEKVAGASAVESVSA